MFCCRRYLFFCLSSLNPPEIRRMLPKKPLPWISQPVSGWPIVENLRSFTAPASTRIADGVAWSDLDKCWSQTLYFCNDLGERGDGGERSPSWPARISRFVTCLFLKLIMPSRSSEVFSSLVWSSSPCLSPLVWWLLRLLHLSTLHPQAVVYRQVFHKR